MSHVVKTCEKEMDLKNKYAIHQCKFCFVIFFLNLFFNTNISSMKCKKHSSHSCNKY